MKSNDKADSSDPDSPAAAVKSLALVRGSACATCRGRKVRCDAVHPLCTPCMIARKDCVYVPKKKLPGPASAASLGLKLAGLQEKYKELSSASAMMKAPNDLEYISVGHPLRGQASGVLTPQLVAQDVDIADRDAILDIFFQWQYRCAFFVPREKFNELLNNPDPYRRPHPALVEAMLLLGATIATYTHEGSAPSSSVVELLSRVPRAEVLVARIQSHLNQALHNFDRLHDYFTASGMLVHWYFSQGRLQEAQYLSSSTARLIIGSKLHRINSEMLDGMSNELLRSDSTLPWDYTLLGRPSSLLEVGSRILTFWQSFYNDKLIALVTGLPSAYEDSEEARVTTVWPKRFTEYESGAAFQAEDFDSVDELLFAHDTKVSLEHESRYHDTVYALLNQGITFIDRTARFAASCQANPTLSQSEDVYNHILRLQTALDHFSSRVPVSPDGLHQRKTIAQRSERTLENVYYSGFIWAMINVSKIQIYRSLEIHHSYIQGVSSSPHTGPRFSFYLQRVIAAQQAVKAIQSVFDRSSIAPTEQEKTSDDLKVDSSNITIGFLLTSAAVTLVEEIKRQEQPSLENNIDVDLGTQLEATQKDYTLARTMLEQLAVFFPVLGIQVARLNELRNEGGF